MEARQVRLFGKRSLPALFAWVALWDISAAAQTYVALEFVARWPASPGTRVNHISVVGNQAFLAADDGLHIIDVSDPSNPAHSGSYASVGSAVYGVQVVGSHAFVTIAGRGLQVIDVSNAQTPRSVGGVNNGSVGEVDIVGGYAYLPKLEIYDINNVSSPALVGQLHLEGSPVGIRVRDGFAYIGTREAGLKIVKIVDPSQPVLAGYLPRTGEVWDIDLAGDYVFAARHYGSLDVIDIFNFDQPLLVTNLPLRGYPTSLRAAGNRIFVTANEGPVQVVDISDPSRPVLVGSFEISSDAHSIEVADFYAYVAVAEGGIVILRISERPLGFAAQPASLRLETGQSAVFAASAVSVAAFTYQWQKDATDLHDSGRISGAGTSTLTISNSMATDQGCYSLVISNEHGSISSSNASLTVVPGLREALDDPNLVWTTDGRNPWRLQHSVSHDGIDAAEGGPLQTGIAPQGNRISTTVQGPGALHFWWRIEDVDCFTLGFYMNGRLWAEIWGLVSLQWYDVPVWVPPGTNVLTWKFWTYCGDSNPPPPARAWLDKVIYTPGVLLRSEIETNDAASITIKVTGPPGVRVQLRQSADLVSWVGAPYDLQTRTLKNGTTSIAVRKSASQQFYTAVAVANLWPY